MFIASLRVYSWKISTAKGKNSTDVSAASARFSISVEEELNSMRRENKELEKCSISLDEKLNSSKPSKMRYFSHILQYYKCSISEPTLWLAALVYWFSNERGQALWGLTPVCWCFCSTHVHLPARHHMAILKKKSANYQFSKRILRLSILTF